MSVSSHMLILVYAFIYFGPYTIYLPLLLGRYFSQNSLNTIDFWNVQ